MGTTDPWGAVSYNWFDLADTNWYPKSMASWHFLTPEGDDRRWPTFGYIWMNMFSFGWHPNWWEHIRQKWSKLVISFPILSTIHMYRAPICILYVITRKMPERQGELFNMQITTAFFVRLTSTLVKSCWRFSHQVSTSAVRSAKGQWEREGVSAWTPSWDHWFWHWTIWGGADKKTLDSLLAMANLVSSTVHIVRLHPLLVTWWHRQVAWAFQEVYDLNDVISWQTEPSCDPDS